MNRRITKQHIDYLLQRPTTSRDRQILRRLLREEMKRAGWKSEHACGSNCDECVSMTPYQRQIYRIFMSVAAEI